MAVPPLELDSVSKAHGTTQALCDVSFELVPKIPVSVMTGR
jgi:hypothetical protein